MAGVCEHHDRLEAKIDTGFQESHKQMKTIHQALVGEPGPDGEIGLCEYMRTMDNTLTGHLAEAHKVEDRRVKLWFGILISIISAGFIAIGAGAYSAYEKLGGTP